MDDPLGTVNESVRRRFEAAWKAGTPGDLADYLPPAADRHFLPTLVELVGIDLEMRWRKRALGGTMPPAVGEYVSRFPALGRDDVIDDLHRHESELRGRAGEPVVPETNGSPVSPTPVSPPSLPGFARLPRIPDCEIVRELGHGGMGVVYLANQTSLHRQVAVKTIRFAASGPHDLARFLHEAEAIARLHHPNIVPIHDVGRDADPPYFLMEYVEHGTLAGRLEAGPMPAATAATVVETLARAVEYAHQRGVIHRDLKPANILIREVAASADGLPFSPKITDFGLAKTLDLDSQITQTGNVLGTPSYMSPEQAAGQSHLISTRTDVYALGAILYECLTGRPPFRGETVVETLDGVRNKEPIPPSRLRPEISRDLETICLQCLQKDPAQRYARAELLADDLLRYRTHRPVHARRVGAWGVLLRWCRRNPGLSSTLAASVLVVATVAGVGFWNVLRERDKFRIERDRAEGNLYRSLTAEAAGHIDARGPEWWWRATEGIATASRMAIPQREPDELRDLYVRCLGTQYPSLRVSHEWAGGAGRPMRVAVSPDGTMTAIAGTSGTIELRDLPTGANPRTLPGHAGDVTGLAFHPHRNVLYSCSDDGTLVATTLATGGPSRNWASTDGAGLTVLSVGPTGSRLFIGTRAGDVLAFDLDAGGMPAVSPEAIVEGLHSVTGLAVSPDGAVVAIADEGKQVSGRATAGGAELWSFATGDNPAVELRFNATGEHLVYVDIPSFGFVTFAVPTRTTQVYFQIHDRPLNRVFFLRRGFLTASSDGSIRVWGREASRPLFAEWAKGRADFGPIVDAEMTPDESRVVAVYRDGVVRVWEKFEPAERSFRGGFSQAVRFVGESNVLFDGAGFFDCTNAAPARFTATEDRHTSTVWAVDSTADGKLLATGSHDRRVKLWNSDTGRAVATFNVRNTFIWSVAFCPNRPWVAAAHERITIWDTERKTARATLDGHKLMTSAVAFHPTLPLLASAGRDRYFRIWDCESNSLVAEFALTATYAHAIAFDPTGEWFAAGCDDGTVAVWRWDDIAGGNGFGPPRYELKGHTTPVRAVAFSASGVLASGAEQGIVLLRDGRRDFRKLVRLQSGSGQVRSLQFSRDERFLACGVYVSSAIVWDLPAVRAALAPVDLDW